MKEQLKISNKIREYLKKKSTDELIKINGYISDLKKSFTCNIQSEDIELMQDFLKNNLQYLKLKYHYNRTFPNKNKIIFASTPKIYFVTYETNENYKFEICNNKEDALNILYEYINIENK